MTEEILKPLRKERGGIKRSLTASEGFLATIDDETELDELNLDVRFENHLKLWDIFETVQSSIDECTEELEMEPQYSERTSFENRFHRISGLFKKYIKKSNFSTISTVQMTPRSDRVDDPSNQTNHTNQSSTLNRVRNQIEETVLDNGEQSNGIPSHSQDSNPLQFRSRFELPKIQTPVFHGTFDTWLTFHDSFKSMCHDNTSISNIQKFHYLKACLKDEAAEVVSSLETTAANYDVAWNLLKERFDNRKFIVEKHVQELFEIPNLSKEFSVRSLLDQFQKRHRSLKALDLPVQHWDTLLIHILRSKLNNYTREKWEESIGSSQLPTLKKMIDFLEQRALIECTQTQAKANISKQQSKSFASKNATCLSNSVETRKQKIQQSCQLCSKSHMLYACQQFQNMSPQERYEIVKKASICHNCFYANHKTIDCRKRMCFKCDHRHHTLLHFEREKKGEETQPSTTTALVNFQGIGQSQVILGTALVDILDNNGKYRSCRALLDSCSQCNAITSKFAETLGLPKTTINMKLKGIENLQSNISHMVSTQIKSRYDNSNFQLKFLIFQEISETMPSLPIEQNTISIPDTIFLADPSFHTPGQIDVLIGAEYFYQLLRSGQIRIQGQSAVFQETNLGWILSGRYTNSQNKNKFKPKGKNEIVCNLIKFQELPVLWELGEDNKKTVLSASEQAAEENYIRTTKRLESGNYEVCLPFNEKKELLGNSRDVAFQRFYAIERKLAKNLELKKEYSKCIQGYLDAGHMSPLNLEDTLKPGYFLPHHAVIKEDSITTKTRVVFDGSAKSATGVSLNDTLLVGPTIQDDLATIVTRFRSFAFVLTADIQQMYRQIQISEKDRLYQKILWRFSAEEPIKIYSLNTVTFGTSCAPYLAIRTLQQLAEDEKDNFPIVSTILKQDFYVDDLLTGSNTINQALQIRDDLSNLLKKGGFTLRKWASNHTDLCSDLSNDPTDNYMSLDLSNTIKTLGLFWDLKSDSILYTVTNQTDSEDKITKRAILSQCARLFDPLGLLGPVVVVGKILIQQLWKQQLNWDDPVPDDIKTFWIEYKNQLPLLNSIKFPRFIGVENSINVQLHGFCDASEKAYGACLYLRSTDDQGNHHSHLICAKSRVAPLKVVSLPRLELCAAVLLVKLYSSTVNALPIKIQKRVFWTDSSIVLNWVNTPPYKLLTFVANRVSEIQTLTNPMEWKHVPTQDNPADFISRGQEVTKFLENIVWARGPSWLCESEEAWPEFELQIRDVPDTRPNQPLSIFKITQFGTDILRKYSNICKLKRVVAYCKRFINSSKIKTPNDREKGALTPRELEEAMMIIIKLVQLETFPRELDLLSKNQKVEQKSQLVHLSPFIENGVLKVGGRLNNAAIPESQKHPIVLPKGHPITKLMIKNEHEKRLHAGVNATLYGIRESYWPIDGRNVTRHVIRKCVKCFRAKPREVDYIMGSLPKNRVSASRPFLHTGVDFCGPFYTKEFRLRNRTKIKTYVCIFVCFATKAVHLELANDLSTEAFLACLKRFFARRGLSKSMHSDNGTNFVGANKELKSMFQQIYSTIQNESIQNFLSGKSISWHFNPPRAPHFGGLWEAAVKSFKTHFTRIAGNFLLSYEQLHTYVVEIEAILNSRPLTALSSDPNDLAPLSPAHFLIGSSMTCIPQEDLRNIPAGRLNCWQTIQQMRHHFWDRWHREYLHEMISRSKWQSATNQANVQSGTLVVIKDDNLPPMRWALGRIVDTHPGPDGIVRVVTVRSPTGTYKRALKKLYPLPINDDQ